MEYKQKKIDSEICHDLLVKNIKPQLAYGCGLKSDEWKKQLKQKFIDILGIEVIKENDCPLNFQIEWEKDKGDYRIIRFTIESEKNEIVPCYILIPKLGKEKYPVCITMQGHTTGFHNSIGEPQDEDEVEYGSVPRNAFALQAVKRGYVALAIEQRGMGERKPHRIDRSAHINCRWAYRVALMLGRTLIGERIWDIGKCIDALKYFPECDLDKIIMTGNSGGGTISYYYACLDERIKLCVPSCAYCTYDRSILLLAHCGCNYLPGALRYFDMQDLSCLIAPRNLIIFAGKNDDIFLIDGVEKAFAITKQIYKDNGCEDKCKLIETPRGHWWCPNLIWEEISKECKKMGW